MSGQKPQIDYDALADQARKQATSAVPASKKAAQPAAVDYDALAAQARQAQVPAPPAPDLTANSIDPATGKGYGLYRMGSYDFDQGQVTHPEIQVPYNRVGEAQAAGYKLHPDEAPRYQKDSSHVGQGPTTYEQVASLLNRMTAPMPDRPLTGNPIQQAGAALTNIGQLPFNVVNRAYRGLAGLPQGVAQTAVNIHRGDPAGIESLNPFAMGEGAVRNLSEDAQSLGPMAALGNLGGDALTMYATGKLGSRATEAGTEAMMKVAKGVRNAPESLARIATGTGTGPVKELVKQRQLANAGIDEANAAADKDHAGNTQDALHEQRGREIEYQTAVDSKTQEIAQADQSEAEQLAAKQSAAEQKVAAANEAVKAKHQAVAQKVTDANRAAENALELRRQLEQTYQQATDDYRAQNAAADVRAKGEENSAWSAFRQKMTGKGISSEPIIEHLKQIEVLSPEVAQSLRKLQISPEDAPLDSEFAKDRAAVMKALGYTGNYFDYPADVRASFNRAAMAHGFEPDLIDFNPQEGQTLPVDLVQRASSIVQGYLRDRRFDGNGPVRGEMMQLAKTLRAVITRAAAEAGATAELDAARNSTIVRQGAFGKPPRKVATTSSNLERDANPEAAAVRAKEEALDRTRRYDPTLVDSYRQVKAARKALDSLSPEDQLRKRLRQVPPPPTVNDPRPGFRLTAPPQRTPARPASGSPAERAFQSVDQPSRPNFPDRPIPDPHQTISAGDIAAAKRAAVEASAGKWWTRGRWAAAAPIIWAMRGFFGGHIPSIPRAGAESGGILAATHVGVSLLRYPPLVDFLVKARPKDVAVIPLELRGDLPGLVSQAQRQGIKVSPALLAATGGALAAQKKEGPQGLQLPIPVAQALQAMQPTFSQGATQ